MTPKALSTHIQKKPSFPNIDTLIFDVDNTLYTQNHAVLKDAKEALCGAARQHLGPLPESIDDEWLALFGYRGLKEHGDATAILGNAPDADQRALHALFHKNWPTRHICPDAYLTDALARLKQRGKTLYAYSDAHQDWTRRVLKHIGMDNIFDADKILTKDQLPYFDSKRQNDKGYRHIQRISTKDYNRILMVDDSEVNLVHAKALGIKTVLITHGVKPTLIPPTHDMAYCNTADFIAEFCSAQKKQEPLRVTSTCQRDR